MSYEAEVQQAITTIRCGTWTSKNELEEAVEVLLLDHERLSREVARLRAALRWLVEVIDKAGLLNLSRGVQLGRTSWYVKASDALEAARAAILRGEGEK